MTAVEMGTTYLYAWVSAFLSLVALILTLVYLRNATRTYRIYHDERAANALGKAVGLLVVAFGLLISSAGLIVGVSALATIGLSVARGALLVLMFTLVLAGVRPDAWKDGKDKDENS